jgi:hypothetical protein
MYSLSLCPFRKHFALLDATEIECSPLSWFLDFWPRGIVTDLALSVLSLRLPGHQKFSRMLLTMLDEEGNLVSGRFWSFHLP